MLALVIIGYTGYSPLRKHRLRPRNKRLYKTKKRKTEVFISILLLNLHYVKYKQTSIVMISRNEGIDGEKTK